MDRNMITVMTGQVVDFFDRDFREMYAISEKLNLYKEFHVSAPASRAPAAAVRPKAGSIRPVMPATTSRFQVNLGESRRGNIQVPAHKYNNPKYLLALGDAPRPSGSLQGKGPNRGPVLPGPPDDTDRQRAASRMMMDWVNQVPSEASNDSFKNVNGIKQEKKGWSTWKKRFSKGKSSSKLSDNSPCPSPTGTKQTENDDSFEVTPNKMTKKQSKLSRKTTSQQTVGAAQDNESKSKIMRLYCT